MNEIDLRDFNDNSFVLHFGGRANEVDALTFGNALVSIAESIRAINTEVNLGYSIEITIEAVGPGSFRTSVKTIKKSLRNLFSGDSARNLVIGLFATFLWEKVISPNEQPKIIINEDMVIIQHGNDRIVVPKEVLEHKEKINRSPAVNRCVAKSMEVLENDPSISSLGFTKHISDTLPLIEFPRSTFSLIRQNSVPISDEKRRYVDQDATLSLHKAVFERSSRKWEFVWNGFKISAPILDQTFFDRLEAGVISLRHGDAFRAVLRVHQRFDILSETWLNENYEVIVVGDLVSHKDKQTKILQ